MSHRPVLLGEALAALDVRPGGLYVDATFGGGGHARAILEAADCGLIAIDRDPDALARAGPLQAVFGQRLQLAAGRFGAMAELIDARVDGVVLDLGVSSFQLDEAERGFSFQADAPLDMRMEKAGPSAADAVNALSEAALSDLLKGFGEEAEHRRVARAIVAARAAAPITRTGALAELVERALGGRRGRRTHPATRTFQALRMLVNDELAELARALAGAETLLKPGGRLAVVSFHSLEDRLVKSFLLARSGGGGHGSRHAPEAPAGPPPSFTLETRRIITPGDCEIETNPRARSAGLRWAVRTQAPAQGAFAAPALAPKAEAEWKKLG
ncbi:MAG: 16S rRNA (cytosine(1402)-N(4))-methyltransferase RsmH [Hyphomonadaceae bacterium]